LLGYLVKIKRGCPGLGYHNQIKRRIQSSPVQPKKLADTPLDVISVNGISNSFADRNPKARLIRTAGCGDYQKMSGMDATSPPGDVSELGAGSDAP
jgi:hypothetical protein